MDSLITAAARALATGDALGALNFIAVRDDAQALALRGIAMAQLGDLVRARQLLRRAARAFGPREAVARARCVTAEAEIALVSRDLTWPLKPLGAARLVLERHGDRANAAHACYLEARFLLLVGRLDRAERLLEEFDAEPLAPPSRVGHELVVAGIAMRRLRIVVARAALVRARNLAREIRIPSLIAEVASAVQALEMPVARLISRGEERPVRLGDIEALFASKALVVDACRHVVVQLGTTISLETRPVLLALARALGESWPGGASRATLLARAFRSKHVDDPHRARLRVEIGRLRKVLRDLAKIDATKDGFVISPRRGRELIVIAPLSDAAHASVLALMSDGEAWSTSALALAHGVSQRTAQRDLEDLLRDGKVQTIGRGRARRWMAPPVPGFPTTLLLPAALPGG